MKKIFTLFLIIYLTFFDVIQVWAIDTNNNKTYIVEAEDSEYLSNIPNLKDEKLSNGEAIFLPNANVNGIYAYCKFTFTIEKAGFYDVSINSYGTNFDGVQSERLNFINVDEERLQADYLNIFLKSPVNKWTEHKFFSNQYFTEGEHTITISGGYANIYIDYLKLELISEFSLNEVFGDSYVLNNKNASENTKKLFEYLKDNYGKNILTGQITYEDFDDPKLQRILNVTGKLPAILGLDLLPVTPTYKDLLKLSYPWIPYRNMDKVISTAEDYYLNKGGIVSFSWHWSLDYTFMDKLDNKEYESPWESYRSEHVNIDLDKVLSNPDSKEYQLLIKDIDAIAKELKTLSDKDVPILFRPLHEAGGEWFWWNTAGPENYKKLWNLLYDKFTNEYHLNNLIWIWNGYDVDWYPGDEYVDICAADIYLAKQNYIPRTTGFFKFVGITNGKKMVSMTETGTLFDIDKAVEKKAMWSWFSNWNGDFAIPEDNSTDFYSSLEMWNKVYNHEKVITLDELPFHKHSDENNDKICDICRAKIEDKTPIEDKDNNDVTDDKPQTGDNSNVSDNNSNVSDNNSNDNIKEPPSNNSVNTDPIINEANDNKTNNTKVIYSNKNNTSISNNQDKETNSQDKEINQETNEDHNNENDSKKDNNNLGQNKEVNEKKNDYKEEEKPSNPLIVWLVSIVIIFLSLIVIFKYFSKRK